MKITNVVALSALLSIGSFAAEKKVNVSALPSAVQKAVQEQTQHAKLVGVTKEVERGKTMYEVETTANGKTRDLMLDANGAVASVEQEVTLDSIPAAAQAAIQKTVGAGKIVKVETVTAGSNEYYEAAYVRKGGKTAEVSVNADGSAHK